MTGTPETAPVWFTEAISKLETDITTKVTENVKQLIDNINIKVNTLAVEVGTFKPLKTTVTNNTERIQRLESMLSKQSELLDNQASKIASLEAYGKRKNIIIDGVSEDVEEKDLVSNVFEIFETNLEIENAESVLSIQNCFRMGKKTPRWGEAGRPRSIMIKFANYNNKVEVWRRKAKLKNSGFFLSEDFPVRIRENRQKLFPYYQYAKETCEKVSLVQDRLYVNGSVYTVSTLNNLPQEITVGATAKHTKTVGNLTLFFRKYSPFSNFYDSPFSDTVRGVFYSCGEQCLQGEKALLFGDKLTYKLIMDAKTPGRMKYLGSKVKDFQKDVWARERGHITQKVVQLKFQQNPDLLKVLLKTTGLIAECNPKDKIFGIGLTIDDPKAADRNNWKGANLLGETLVSIREDLKLLRS